MTGSKDKDLQQDEGAGASNADAAKSAKDADAHRSAQNTGAKPGRG